MNPPCFRPLPKKPLAFIQSSAARGSIKEYFSELQAIFSFMADWLILL